MIYLSGGMQAEKIGLRKDIGVMVGFRPKKDFYGKVNRFDRCLWAADNGCFTNPNLNVEDFMKWLEQMKKFQETCLFAVAPDVVGDAEATRERALPVLPLIRQLGYEAAFVAQDGMENLSMPWHEFDCLFIGGSTEWKCSDESFYLIREAVKRGKWVHVGRVNSMRRILWARFAGAHSCDGTTIAFAPDKRMKDVEKWLDVIKSQPTFIF